MAKKEIEEAQVIMHINEVDLGAIKGLNEEKQKVNEQMIRLGWSEIDVKLFKESVEKSAVEVSQKERELMEEISKRYGKIQDLDIESGAYTLMPEETLKPE